MSESYLVVCPDRAYLPENLSRGGRTAGFNITLYGLRSDRNWGCGDFTDLRALIDWASVEIRVKLYRPESATCASQPSPLQHQPLSAPLDLLQKSHLHRYRKRSGMQVIALCPASSALSPDAGQDS